MYIVHTRITRLVAVCAAALIFGAAVGAGPALAAPVATCALTDWGGDADPLPGGK